MILIHPCFIITGNSGNKKTPVSLTQILLNTSIPFLSIYLRE